MLWGSLFLFVHTIEIVPRISARFIVLLTIISRALVVVSVEVLLCVMLSPTIVLLLEAVLPSVVSVVGEDVVSASIFAFVETVINQLD